ncbi:Leucine_rich repeats-containing protein [Hexamita inflata]|uniref:Leucine rich repeats-containing protein n=1 Tax=Hexamita inflata TaxID=28002 RepID=A0AA86R6T0_9EUKA|nr:Leucine rich repeats-containing protein [Hexamita inflata]
MFQLECLFGQNPAKLTINMEKYERMEHNNLNIYEINNKCRIEQLQFINIDKPIVFGEYVNVLQLKHLCITGQYLIKTQELDINIFNNIEQNTLLETLSIKNYKIKDQQPLMKLKALQNLILVGDLIQDYDILQNFHLRFFSISHASLSYKDKHIISQLYQLRQLIIYGCGFNEVHQLQELQQLRQLTLSSNQINNSNFVGCSFRLLQKLDVSENSLQSLDYITDLSPCLFEINANHNKIDRILHFSSLNTNIERLDLSFNKLRDINQLLLFQNLKDLNIGFNKIGEKSLRILKNLQIQTLNITQTRCRSLNCVNTETLTHIEMNRNTNTNFDTSNLFQCKNLKAFHINSAILPNNKLKKLKIIQQNSYIQKNQLGVLQNDNVPFAVKRLLFFIRMRVQDSKLTQMHWNLAQVNFALAMQLKDLGFQTTTNKRQTTDCKTQYINK